MLKQQHYTLTNVKKVKLQSTTSLDFKKRVTLHKKYILKIKIIKKHLLKKDSSKVIRYIFVIR